MEECTPLKEKMGCECRRTKGLISFVCIIVVNRSTGSHHHQDWWKQLVPPDYSKESPPFTINENNESNPVAVELDILPRLVSSVSLRGMDFQVEFQMAINWIDNRLQNLFNKKKVHKTLLPDEMVHALWIPDLTFANCKACDSEIINPKKHRVYIEWTENDTSIVVMLRDISLFTCAFNLHSYPFDTQTCYFIIELNENSQEVHLFGYLWRDVDTLDIPVPPEFILDQVVVGDHHKDNSTDTVQVTFTFQREILPHLMLLYIPSLLIVILSWISFWLDPLMAAPRVALGLTSLLTLSTQFSSAQKDLPPTHQLKALDVWMFACIFIVFASLMEFALINFCHRRENHLSTLKVHPIDGETTEPALAALTNSARLAQKAMDRRMKTWLLTARNTLATNHCHCSLSTLRPKRIDQACRLLFPAGFLIFNLAYWLHYQL